MRKKRLVALLLVVAMIASMVVPSVAAEDAYTVSIVDNATGAATIDANPGDEVTLKMVLSNNPGVSSVFVNIDYPEGWTVKGYEDKELFADEAATTPQFSPLTNNPFSCIWVMPTGTKTTLEDAGMQLPTQNGELFLIQFQIPADAELGTYTVDLDTTSNGDLVDGNFAYETYEDGTINPEERHNLTLATQGMTINVTEPEPEAPVYDPAQVACPCASCNGAVPTWEVWDEAKAAEGGHFYLTEAATLSAEITIPANVTTVINLSGQTMTAASGKRAFTVAADGALYIIDGTEDDKGTLQGGGTALASGTHGGVVYANDGRFELHDATVTGGEVTAARGGNIYGNYDNSVIVINNGKVLDGAGTGTTRGGNICVYYGTLYVYGEDAEISGGDASAKGYGGNIYVGNAGKLNMYGGTVSGGTAKYGQDVCGLGNAANHANIYMYGGTVGTAEVDECAYIYGSASSQVCHFYLYGGTVYGFTDTGTYNTIALYNGIIEADPTTINSDGSSALAACACVVKTGDTYTIWNYKHAAGTCTEDCKYEEALAADEEDNNYSIVQQTGAHTCTALNDDNTQTCTVCGATEMATYCQTCEAYKIWTNWDGTESLTGGGHYRMTTDVTLTSRINVKSGVTLCLDLNGQTLTAPATARAFKVTTGTLSVMDSAFDAAVDADGNLTGTAGKIVGGTIDNGGNIYVETSGTFDLWSGVITGGTANNTGGNIYAAASTVNIHGGIVYGGTAANGGNVYVTKGTLNVDGGTIHGGSSSGMGGNIYVTKGSFDLSGGTISGGTAATYGGNLLVNSGTKLNMYGGTVTGGTHGDDADGGNLYIGTAADDEGVYASVCVYGGTITNGNVDCGGSASGTLDIYNVTIDSDPGEYVAACSDYCKDGDVYKVWHTGEDHTEEMARVAEADKNTDVHDWQDATCTAAKTCANCGQTEGDPLGHKYPEDWTNNGDNHIKVCANGCGEDLIEAHTYGDDDKCVCGAIFDCDHEYGDYTSNGDATCKADGTKSATCSLCGYVDTVTDTGSQIDHDYSGSYSNDGDNHKVYCVYDCGEYQTEEHTYNWENGVGTCDCGATINCEHDYTLDGDKLICGNCGAQEAAVYCQTCEAYQIWEDWDGTTSITGGGHYRMTTNVTLTSRINVTKNLCLDLNGQTLTAPDSDRAFKVTDVTLSIMDSGFAASVDADGNLTGETGKIVGGKTGNGGTIYVDGGTIDLWSGVITGGTATTNGGNIWASGSAVNIHDGIVYSGTSTKYGGNIYAASGTTIEVDGGIIHGGTSSGNMGGNIYATSRSVVNLNGGTISGGTAATYGGNICVNSGATLNMYGGTVTGGTHGKDCEGGNLYVGTADDEGVYAAVSVYGGTITNGNVDCGGSASGTLDIYNVTIDSDPGEYVAACSDYCKDGDVYKVWHTGEDHTEEMALVAEADKNAPLEHDYNAEVTDPDCENGGYTTYTCSICGKSYVDGQQDALGHELTKTEAVEDTCIAAGNSAYWTCEVCGKYFNDAEGNTEIEEGSWIIDEITGHSMTHHEAVGSTCTEDGTIEYYSCSVCGKNFADEAGEEELDSIVDAADGHDMTHHEAVGSTCTEDGTIEYYSCSVCGKNFADEAGEEELDSIVDAADGHAYGVWEQHNETQHKHICANDGTHVEYADHDYDSVVTGPTNTENGYTTYTCKDCKYSYVVVDEGSTIHFAVNETTGESYTSVQAALNAASKGETVKLLKDATEEDVYVGVQKTLDLNGHKLTAETVSASFVTSYIIDSTNGEGLLAVDKANISLNSNNTQLPLWTEEGARFVNVSFVRGLGFQDKTGAANSNVAYYRFAFNDLADDTILDEFLANGTEGTGISIRIKTTWTNASGTVTQYFTLTSELVEKYANWNGGWDRAMFAMYLTGVEGLENLSFTAEIVSTANPQATVVIASESIS